MRIISYNINGIRSAISKGFCDWLATDPADIVCLQEVKATQHDIEHGPIEALGFHSYWFPAQKKGYSGVSIFTRIAPDRVVYGTGVPDSDAEGRVLRIDIGEVTIINAYYPSGSSGELRQAYKYQWLETFLDFLSQLGKKRKKLVICGDYNIAHREIDIHNPKGNKKTSGFLPEERAWMDRFLENGFVDTFRLIHPDKAGCYSWWSRRFPHVRAENKGWRIDYVCVSESLRSHVTDARIYPDVQHSDHCPIYAQLSV